MRSISKAELEDKVANRAPRNFHESRQQEADRVYERALQHTLLTSQNAAKIDENLDSVANRGAKSLEEIVDGLSRVNR